MNEKTNDESKDVIPQGQVSPELIDLEKQKVQSAKEINQGWQELAKEGIASLKNYYVEKLMNERAIVSSLVKWTVASAIIIMLILSVLTYLDKMPATTLATVIGIIIGSLVTLSAIILKKGGLPK